MLSGEQLLTSAARVFHALGVDPVAIEPATQVEIKARAGEFREHLPHILGKLQTASVDDGWVLEASKAADRGQP